MIWANLIASMRKQDGGHDRRDVNALHDCKQCVVSNYAVGQKQCAGNEPDEPGRNADTPGAFFYVEMAYLRHICNYDQRRPSPTEHFQL